MNPGLSLVNWTSPEPIRAKVYWQLSFRRLILHHIIGRVFGVLGLGHHDRSGLGIAFQLLDEHLQFILHFGDLVKCMARLFAEDSCIVLKVPFLHNKITRDVPVCQTDH